LTAIDVGQGDALLAAFPDGKLMLVDGGGIPTFGKAPKPRIDTGEDVVSPYLWGRGIRRVDVIVSTHSHDDHCDGLPALIRNFRPHEVWYGFHGDPFLPAAKEFGAQVRQPRAGERINFGAAQIDVLSPERDYEPGPKPENDDSLVLRIRYGERSFLLTGDIDGGVEWRIASSPDFGPIDVLKVAHHGSRHSTTELFLERARPRFAVASAGYDNRFGHPNPEVLRRLVDAHTGIYRTDRDGLVSIVTDGRRIWVRTFDDLRRSNWLLPGFAAD
jgi:competence protein ComEC